MKNVFLIGWICLSLMWPGTTFWVNAATNTTNNPDLNKLEVLDSTAVHMGIGASWAEEAELPRPAEYQLKPEFIEALRLTKEQEQALREYMPEFLAWTAGDYPQAVQKHYPHSISQLPYMISGDLDGNGLQDKAVAGRTNSMNVVLALMSDATGYHVLPILASVKDPGRPELDVLFLLRKGTRFAIDAEDEAGPEEVMANDGIQQATIGAASAAFDGRRETKRLIRYAEGLKSVRPVSVSSPKPAAFKAKYKKDLALTPAMQKAVQAYDKGFTIWNLRDYPAGALKDYPYAANALPYAVKGDLNTDGISDMVVAGHNSDGNRILVLLSSGTGYTVHGGSSECYKEAAVNGQKRPYLPSEILRIYERGAQIYDSYNMPVKVNGNMYSYQTIYSCDSQDSLRMSEAASWKEVSSTPEYSAYVKMFEQEYYHDLKIIIPPSGKTTHSD